MVNLLKSIREDPRVKQLGPGLITGAADDDPSGIATYSQAGAQFGYNMLWTVLFTYPLMVGIQMVSARLGCITGRGLAANNRSSIQQMTGCYTCQAAPIAWVQTAIIRRRRRSIASPWMDSGWIGLRSPTANSASSSTRLAMSLLLN